MEEEQDDKDEVAEIQDSQKCTGKTQHCVYKAEKNLKTKRLQ